MKTALPILFVVLSFASVSASAAGDSCKKISALAGQAMAARQGGQLLEDSLNKIGDGSKFAQGMILKAYDQPLIPNKHAKEEAVKEFQNTAFRECFDANS